jgi:SAM-dependent methyltransferase
LSVAYGAWYRPDSGRFSGFGDRLLRRTRGLLADRIDRLAPPGPVLDVGAGDGALIDALGDAGRKAFGLERDARRDDMTNTPLSEVDGEWAAVVFWHSLEHLPDAGEEVARACRALAPDGVLLVAMPNSESLQARLFGHRWFARDVPRHLVHVPARALVGRLRSLGLAVERISFWRGGQVLFGWLHGLVGSLPGHPDLYDAIRRPEARQRPVSPTVRAFTVLAAALLTPFAAAAAAGEVLVRRGGTVYVEARRA